MGWKGQWIAFHLHWQMIATSLDINMQQMEGEDTHE